MRAAEDAMVTTKPVSVVLVGGGHAHVEVLRVWKKRARSHARLTLVVDRADAVYSGMIPGVIARQYELAQATIPLAPLAAAAGAHIIVAPVLRVDADARLLDVQGHAPVAYDVASLDVGSVPQGLDAPAVPGVNEHALATRPIADLVNRLDACVARLRSASNDKPLRLIVAGGGPAGVELACALLTRMQAAGTAVEITIVAPAPQPVSTATAAAMAKVRSALARRGIAYLSGHKVVEVCADAVIAQAEGGGSASRVDADLVVWATGAAPPPVVRASALPHDARGFVLTTSTLQVKGHATLFAAGDCAVMEDRPDVPRAGVFAVRAGPVLSDNLHAVLRNGPLRAYRPQSNYLSLINTCDGRALAFRGGWSMAGRSLWLMKDWIDRRFVARYTRP